MPTFKLDGRDISFQPGDTIMRAAWREGVEIPHYCWHPGLSVAANCRMCLVEVKAERPVMMPVMAWDEQGLAVAAAGARLLDLLPLFSEPISRTFAGGGAVPSSFFFMNLFLHVALPLGLAGLLWLHVSRLARPALLPPRPLLAGWLAFLVVVAVAAPAPLLAPADPLALPGRLRLDLLYTFWVPFAQAVKAAVPFMIIMGLDLALVIAFPQIAMWLPDQLFGGR